MSTGDNQQTSTGSGSGSDSGSGAAGGLGPPPDTIASPPPSRDHLIQLVFPTEPPTNDPGPQRDDD